MTAVGSQFAHSPDATNPQEHPLLADAAWDLIVVGAGAAGLLGAARAAERGRRVLLLEKNRKLGVKILMSGGTRCNLTHDLTAQGILAEFPTHQGRFLRAALATLGPSDLIGIFHAEGVPTKLEEATGKIFPASDKALDVVWALTQRVQRAGVTVRSQCPVLTIERSGEHFYVATPNGIEHAKKLLLTTGGQSYPGCGTTGDGYTWARSLGHQITALQPALVPLTTDLTWVQSLQGLTIPEAGLVVFDPAVKAATGSDKKAKLHSRRGSFLFTHWGMSGPVVLDVSRAATGHAGPTCLACDFLPDEREEDLDARLQQQLHEQGKRQLGTVFGQLAPTRLAEALLASAGLPADRPAAEVSRSDRRTLVQLLKAAVVPITGSMGYKKAEVTAGGVSLAEVNPNTMESRLVPGLYFAGELLDIDGPIGGFNFQAAFATGWLAAESV